MIQEREVQMEIQEVSHWSESSAGKISPNHGEHVGTCSHTDTMGTSMHCGDIQQTGPRNANCEI